MDDLEFEISPEQSVYIKLKMTVAHEELAQSDRPTSERSLTARNYDSSITALGEYLEVSGHPLPTRPVLEQWRKDMQSGKLGRIYKPTTVNARLSAVRKLLRKVASETTDMMLRFVIEHWATVADVKADARQVTEPEQEQLLISQKLLTKWLNDIDRESIKGLRDRAIISIMGGAGLRVSEVAQLTVRDVFLAKDENDHRAIHIRSGKNDQERWVLLDSWNSWIIDATKDYLDALELNTLDNASEPLFRGVQRVSGGYISQDNALSKRGVQRAVTDYTLVIDSQEVTPTPRDLRRSYAIICLQNGMSWSAVSANLGHSSIAMTEKLVGQFLPEPSRTPTWTIKLKN